MACSEISLHELSKPCTAGNQPQTKSIRLESGYRVYGAGRARLNEDKKWLIECDLIAFHDLSDIHTLIDEEHGRTLDFIVSGEMMKFKNEVLGNDGKAITFIDEKNNAIFIYHGCTFVWCDYKKVFMQNVLGRSIFSHSAFTIRFETSSVEWIK